MKTTRRYPTYIPYIFAVAGACGGSGDLREPSIDKTLCTEMLESTVDEDTTVGPGCIRVQRTNVNNNATLTIEPGTTVLMEPGGYIKVDGVLESATLVAIGTESDPIVFTSAAEVPAAGDWQCVRITGNGEGSELSQVIFEYGGQPCTATGADYEGMLDVDTGIRAIEEVTFRHSETHGLRLSTRAAVGSIRNNVFEDNGSDSIAVSREQWLRVGTGHVFMDSDDHIEIMAAIAGGLSDSGLIPKQEVPYRIVGGTAISGGAVVEIEAGTRIELTGGSIEVFTASLDILGTPADPVVFTSANASPVAGDWGCLLYNAPSSAPRIENAVFEYAGSGGGCGGNNQIIAAVSAPTATTFTNTVFRNIDGAAIHSASECGASWCDSMFDGLAAEPLLCENSQVTSCP